MDPHILTLLCDPETRETLEFQPDALVNLRSGKCYPLRHGVPDFVNTVSGQNKKYQELYDRIALIYDLSGRLYVWFTRKRQFRRAFLDEVEVPSGTRVLEVSVGTGANLRFFSPDTDLFGLDLSWGMLRQCRKNLRKSNRTAEQFHGEAEHLPFRDAVFDVVFHVGGINFFNGKAAAVQEMIRVAKPGTKIVIVDETEKVVREQCEKTPLLGRYFRKRAEPVSNPMLLVPANMQDVTCNQIMDGKAYCLTFRKPFE